MIAKSMGGGWYAYYKNYLGEIPAKLNELFQSYSEMGDCGDLTELKLLTEYDDELSGYNIIEHSSI